MPTIERITAVTPGLVEALNRLLPQLDPAHSPTTEAALTEVIRPATTHLLVAHAEDDAIVGMLTVVLFRTPSAQRAWVEDVVVDTAARGQGIGEALTRQALQIAADAGAQYVDLTSRPFRQAAHRLYERIGFVRRDTHAYRFTFK